MSAGTDVLDFTLDGNDAFHDVSDTHPFHLPHIWSSCDSPGATCVLNVTTVTMPVLKPGNLFPSNGSSAPLSAFELKTKFKSREAIWDAIGGGGSSAADKNNTICQLINERAYDWALAHAAPSVRAAFESDGEPMIMVEDVAAPIGATGPTWIAKELVYTRVQDGQDGQIHKLRIGSQAAAAMSGHGRASSHIEVQSWQFVVGNVPIKSKYVPAGMHYCKLLSPARAMEWIYLEGLRARLSLSFSRSKA